MIYAVNPQTGEGGIHLLSGTSVCMFKSFINIESVPVFWLSLCILASINISLLFVKKSCCWLKHKKQPLFEFIPSISPSPSGNLFCSWKNTRVSDTALLMLSTSHWLKASTSCCRVLALFIHQGTISLQVSHHIKFITMMPGTLPGPTETAICQTYMCPHYCSFGKTSIK